MSSSQYFSCAPAQSPVSLLAVSSKDSERLALKNLTADWRWKCHEARNIEEALAVVSNKEIGAVLTEPELSDGTWIQLLDHLRSRCNPPRVIVYSPVADDRFWAEVLNLGGYDVLATPFDPAEVLRAAHIAWLSWCKTARVTPPEDLREPVYVPRPRRWLAAQLGK